MSITRQTENENEQSKNLADNLRHVVICCHYNQFVLGEGGRYQDEFIDIPKNTMIFFSGTAILGDDPMFSSSSPSLALPDPAFKFLKTAGVIKSTAQLFRVTSLHRFL